MKKRTIVAGMILLAVVAAAFATQVANHATTTSAPLGPEGGAALKSAGKADSFTGKPGAVAPPAVRPEFRDQGPMGSQAQSQAQSRAQAQDGASGGAARSTKSEVIGGPADLAVLPPLPDLPPSSNKVIKNANLELKLKKGDFQNQFAKASSLAEQFGGYVGSSSVTQVKDNLSSGSLTLKIPADRFQAAMERLKALGKVSGEEQSGQDVGREFVDLEARLHQAQAQEAFYLKLLDQSKSISDSLQIQQQLSSIQVQVEQIQGQLQYLRDQTSYSTVTVHLFEDGLAPEPPAHGLNQAWHKAVASFEGVAGALVVALGWLAPLALIGLAVFGLWKLSHRPKTKPASADSH